MRLLILHVDRFVCTITEKGRSPIVETPSRPSFEIVNGLLVLAAAEAGDEQSAEQVASDASHEVSRLVEQLRVREVMVLPFAHLFAELAPPQAALAMIDSLVSHLGSRGLHVERPPFGWFHSWDLQAKGHPLSRVARRIEPRIASGLGGQ